jgi:hypothetical protein
MIFDLSPISGSINEKYDLVTAKELLRHSSVAVAAAHYVENRKRGTTGLGALLKASGEKLSLSGRRIARPVPVPAPRSHKASSRRGRSTSD